MVNNTFSSLEEKHYQRQVQKKAGFVVTGMGKENLFSTQKPDSKISLKTEDSISLKTDGYGYSSLAPNAPEEVREAWKEAEKAAGVKSGKLNHLSTLFALQEEQKRSTGNADLFGKTADSAVDVVKKALSQLESQPASGTSKTQEYREQEKIFYQAFLSYMTAA